MELDKKFYQCFCGWCDAVPKWMISSDDTSTVTCMEHIPNVAMIDDDVDGPLWAVVVTEEW